jgi:cytoskeletal protein RodZ
MKRCPQCNSLFNDEEHFCELDGTPLVEENETLVTNAVPPLRESPETKGVLLIGALAGVIIGMLLFLVYFALTKEKPQDESSRSSSNVSVAQPQLPSGPVQPPPESSPSPSVEPSPSPSVEPSPTAQPSPAQIQLSGNPISTAGAKSGPVVIKLQTGTSIEAEEAWQTGEGIWYRKSGVVSLLDPKDVKAIEKVPAPSPQPSPESTKP